MSCLLLPLAHDTLFAMLDPMQLAFLVPYVAVQFLIAALVSRYREIITGKQLSFWSRSIVGSGYSWASFIPIMLVALMIWPKLTMPTLSKADLKLELEEAGKTKLKYRGLVRRAYAGQLLCQVVFVGASLWLK